MKDWKCKRCGGYVLVNIDNIEINEIVVFRIYNRSRRFRGFIVVCARVLSKNENFLYVVDGVDFYYIDVKYVYPKNAPVAFVYNMFWTCSC